MYYMQLADENRGFHMLPNRGTPTTYAEPELMRVLRGEHISDLPVGDGAITFAVVKSDRALPPTADAKARAEVAREVLQARVWAVDASAAPGGRTKQFKFGRVKSLREARVRRSETAFGSASAKPKGLNLACAQHVAQGLQNLVEMPGALRRAGYCDDGSSANCFSLRTSAVTINGVQRRPQHADASNGGVHADLLVFFDPQASPCGACGVVYSSEAERLVDFDLGHMLAARVEVDESSLPAAKGRGLDYRCMPLVLHLDIAAPASAPSAASSAAGAAISHLAVAIHITLDTFGTGIAAVRRIATIFGSRSRTFHLATAEAGKQ